MATTVHVRPDAVAFFYEHAGYSYDPKTQTPEEGRQEGALCLAKAEARGKRTGMRFEWKHDPQVTSADWREAHEDGGRHRRPWRTWMCLCWYRSSMMASLGGIDFGRHGDPVSDPYGRVVQAELAAEAFAEIDRE